MSEHSAAEYAALINRYIDGGYTDGLPVVPPYREAVAAMVAASGRSGDEVLGLVPPRDGAATVEAVAINAVMAGCLPAYMPVVVAALEAMLDPAFNLTGPACSTKGVAPLVIVNGPVRHRLGINCRGNVFGPGFRANATIGRALRLILINLGGVKSQELDKSTLGHPGKYTYVIGEDEENSPWQPWHVDQGFDPGDSTVTVVACEGPRLVNNHDPAAGAEGILLGVADVMSTLSSFGASGHTDAVVVLAPEHRSTIAAQGWSKEQARDFLFAHSGRRAGEFRHVLDNRRGPAGWAREGDPDDHWVHLFERPESIKIIAAGGAGRMSAVCYGFASEKFSRWQIRKIQD